MCVICVYMSPHTHIMPIHGCRHTCIHIWCIYHSHKDSVSAEQKANRLSGSYINYCLQSLSDVVRQMPSFHVVHSDKNTTIGYVHTYEQLHETMKTFSKLTSLKFAKQRHRPGNFGHRGMCYITLMVAFEYVLLLASICLFTIAWHLYSQRGMRACRYDCVQWPYWLRS